MILVTGGTGLVGSHLLFELLKKHDRVRAIHRAKSNLQHVRHIFSYYTDVPDTYYNRIEWVQANILDVPRLTDAFRDINRVYHAAAYISFDPKNYTALRKANVEGTANLVNLCIANKIEKLCYVSSVATLGSSLDNKPIDEDTHWNPEANNSVYAITKYGAEMEIWRATQEGVPSVIVNPSVIFGPGFWNSGSGAIITMAARGSRYSTSGSTGILDVRDVVRAMLLLMDSETTNRRFILNGTNITFTEMMTMLTKKLDAKAPTKPLPKWICRLMSYLDWFSSVLFDTKRKLPLATVRSLYSESRYDGSALQDQFADFEYTSFEATVAFVATHYKAEKGS
ncbi:MAG: NAD-dependent epimerase [Flavobacteriaceae bacterium]|nr:NAD-dependent epimerase [Flavobacteriaceae bacterium]